MGKGFDSNPDLEYLISHCDADAAALAPWLSVGVFMSEISRIRGMDASMTSSIVLQIMRTLYDHAENNPSEVLDLDLNACFDAIHQLEAAVGKEMDLEVEAV